jgi:hypothetical protein
MDDLNNYESAFSHVNNITTAAYNIECLKTESMVNYQITPVPQTLIEFLWPQIEGFIQSVVDVSHDEVTVESIKSRLIEGSSLLLVTSRLGEIIAATMIEIRTFDSGIKALYIPVVGGTEMDNWSDQFFRIVHAIAKDFGCRELRGLAARKGWVRKLKDKGWEEVCINMRCMVQEG